MIPTSVARIKEKIKDAIEKKGKSKGERCVAALFAVTDFMAAVFGRVREFSYITKDRKGADLHEVEDDKFANIWANDKKVFRFVRGVFATQGYQMWKGELEAWLKLKPDTFADRAALKYPYLWEGYGGDYAEEAGSGNKSLFSRLGRAKKVVLNNMDKRMKKGERATSPASSPVCVCVESQDSL